MHTGEGSAAQIAAGFWGRWCGLDLAGCDPSTISDSARIARYIEELCRLLEFRRYGEPVIVRFGDRLFAYVFVRRWELGIVALLQMVFYSAACVLMGRFLFGERVTLQQGLGMLLAFLGAVLMNGGR